jgi:hypothetical protein
MYIQQELGDQEFVFEDPDYQMTSDPIQSAVLQSTAGEINIETGGAFQAEIMRTDSGFPKIGSHVGSSAGSDDRRSSNT